VRPCFFYNCRSKCVAQIRCSGCIMAFKPCIKISYNRSEMEAIRIAEERKANPMQLPGCLLFRKHYHTGIKSIIHIVFDTLSRLPLRVQPFILIPV